MKAYFIAFILSTFIIQYGICEDLNLYIYQINNQKVLLKIQSSNNDCVHYAFKEDSYKQGNIIRKIYKPYEDADVFHKWIWLTNLAKSLISNQLSEDTYQPDYVYYFRLIKFLQDKVISGYSANIEINQLSINAKIYIVNKMFESQPDDSLTRDLFAFGYGVKAIDTDDIKKLLEKNHDPIILPQPFRESFYLSMKDYYAKIPKTINLRLYLYLTPILLVFIILIASGFYIRLVLQKANRDSQLLKKRLADLDIQLKTENEKLIQQYKGEIVEKERDCLEIISSVLKDLWQIFLDQIISAETKLPIYKIKELVESISKKANSSWAELANKRLNELLQDLSASYLYIPDNISEFNKINWHEEFNSVLEKLRNALASYNHRKISELIIHDVIIMIASAIDGEKYIHGNVDSSIEGDLKSLLEIVGIKEIDVSPGHTYNPQIHELVIDNSKTMVTDRQQRITKVISKGFILPDGKIIKAKVSIQR